MAEMIVSAMVLVHLTIGSVIYLLVLTFFLCASGKVKMDLTLVEKLEEQNEHV